MTENQDHREAEASAGGAGSFSPAFWRLMEMDLSISISLGRAELALQDVLRLTTGSIIELNRSVGDPVDVVVNDRVVARGEVVVVNGSYGVRVQELVGQSGSPEMARDDAAGKAPVKSPVEPDSGETINAADWGLE